MIDEPKKLAVRIKVVSAILAGGAIGWGILGIIMAMARPQSLLLLFPGYVITIWYIVRTFSQP
jgi:hypothetical protein